MEGVFEDNVERDTVWVCVSGGGEELHEDDRYNEGEDAGGGWEVWGDVKESQGGEEKTITVALSMDEQV